MNAGKMVRPASNAVSCHISQVIALRTFLAVLAPITIKKRFRGVQTSIHTSVVPTTRSFKYQCVTAVWPAPAQLRRRVAARRRTTGSVTVYPAGVLPKHCPSIAYFRIRQFCISHRVTNTEHLPDTPPSAHGFHYPPPPARPTFPLPRATPQPS